MSAVFLKLLNLSIAASWLILAVVLLRLLLKKAPRWILCALWALVAVRLVCPFSLESALSLIPSRETVPDNIAIMQTPAINSGITAINEAINPVISQSFTPDPAGSVNPLQIVIPLFAAVWIAGMIAMLLYACVSFVRLKRSVGASITVKDGIMACDEVRSPFILGIMRPVIYVPSSMKGQTLEYVITHETAHIKRRDHWWKPFGYLLLTVYWFDPLCWLAYILLCRDIEMACDEKVIRDMDNSGKAAYSQALLDCSSPRRRLAACPLAFGEVGVKKRVRSVLNYKKPAFWIVVLAAAACIIAAVCFLTDPAVSREFQMTGNNVSSLKTDGILDKIADAENLDDVSMLLVNADNFELTLDNDFNFANDGAIRFFYKEGKKTYSAQLRMFRDNSKYFITERTEWTEQDRSYKLKHYLDALKFLPQEEVRRLSPDADRYMIVQAEIGAPGDFERSVTYTPDGEADIDGWLIHLSVQPLHKIGGAYNGSGDELIHLFYGTDRKKAVCTKWFDYRDGDEMIWDGIREINLDEYPGVTFRWHSEKLEAITEDDTVTLYYGMPVSSVYFCDLNGDGKREICSDVSIGSGIIDDRIIVADYANGAVHELSDRMTYDYRLALHDGRLWAEKRLYNEDEVLASGLLVLRSVVGTDGKAVPMLMIEYNAK